MIEKERLNSTALLRESRDERSDDIWDAAISPANVGTKLQLRPDQRPVRKPKPRLEKSAYVGQQTSHVTLTTLHRELVFGELEVGRRCDTWVHDVAAKLGFELLAYCFMPDHLHVLLQGKSASSDLLRFVQRFKQVTSFHFKQKWGYSLWQQGFYNRVLREDEDAHAVAKYIFDNPSAARLVRGSPAVELRGGENFVQALTDGAEASPLHPPLLREEST